ncbi:MAG: phytoene/squalene synthase family protein [Polyangiales bacterium]
MSAEARRVLAEKSKSFALASKLLPASCRDDVAVVYAYCRHVDDSIDLAPIEERPAALSRLRTEVDEIYDGTSESEFAAVVRKHRIPRLYVDELIAGMAMDVERARYETLEDLHRYGWRVAGVVGTMLCHVFGLRDPRALQNAAHLGIAMQLTNICRDVEEDLRDGRSYLPRALAKGKSVPEVVAILLDDADRFYRSADLGIRALPFRIALGVRAARLVYAAIGGRLRARGCDPFRGRVVVPSIVKAWLVLRAVVATVLERRSPGPLASPNRVLSFPEVVS